MATSKSRSMTGARSKWPQWALALFGVLLVVLYSLVFFTGDRDPLPKLGIDLQGGTRVTLVPQGEDPTSDQLSQARAILENRVNGMGVSGANVITDGDTLVITVPGSDTQEARALGQTSQLFFRPVAQGANPNMETLYDVTIDLANDWVAAGAISVDDANQVLSELHGDISAGLAQQSEAMETEAPDIGPVQTVTAEAPAEPANSLEASDRREQVRDAYLAGRQSEDPTTQVAAGTLMSCTAEGTDPLAGSDDPTLPLVTCDPYADGGGIIVLDPAPLLQGEGEDGDRLSGDDIDTDSAINGGYNQESGQVEVSFRFDSSGGATGAATWSALTNEYLGSQIAIVLDSEVLSAPTIQSATPVGSATAITGDFSIEEAQNLANNLRYGALPLSFAGEDGEAGGTVTTTPPTMGSAALQAGLIAGLIGMVLIVLYAIVLYRGLGVIAVGSLAASFALLYATLVLLGRWIDYSLDLAGIAGIIISIGTTADSFIVFFERIKDELRDGRTYRSAVQHGWNRAKRTIWTGNMVSLIAAAVLYTMAIGDVRGFAFTLGLSTLFDLLTTFIVTAPLVILASRSPKMAKPAWNGFGSIMRLAQSRREQGETLPADVDANTIYSLEEAK